ncbi:carboxypeptidase regulatory-like domain-containing protein [Halosimplex aquaticum]|uniref:Carboxypeptidase regulatory-like domain-containing protein n=1 Tax=Halosimplex aquaticum TaxID=3026162 RepID=A0ABD5Y1Y5_9EURY|nr:carboxypeptidase regulatory-like domain-containing protein [Halosimplex aquaticum]
MELRTLTGDERAIEGLPIRLVIALVVGVASLSVMMNTLGGIQTLGVTELDVRPTPEVIDDSTTDLSVEVVGPQGDRIANATVVASGGTATLDSVTTARTNANGTAALSLSPSLGPNQPEGTIQFSVKPPAGGQYADDRGNTEVLVVSEK